MAPRLIQVLSAIHKNSHLPGKSAREFTPLRRFSLLAAAGLVLTRLLAVVMAFRFSRSALVPVLWLLAGVAVPVLLLVLYR